MESVSMHPNPKSKIQNRDAPQSKIENPKSEGGNMRVIIIGCGRMGSGLAQSMSRRGHEVTVIDRNPETFAALGSSFHGKTITGVGFERDVLLRAGVERADGLAAVTSSDEANIVAARLARQFFRVPCVVARTYEPRKAEIYKRLGVQTIATTTWGINRIADLLSFSGLDVAISLGSDVDLVDVALPPQLEGRHVNELSVPGEIQVVAINRGGRTRLPTLGAEFRPGDRLYIAVAASSLERLRKMLGV
jgi:trk system potassium uptake protein TrkA